MFENLMQTIYCSLMLELQYWVVAIVKVAKL